MEMLSRLRLLVLLALASPCAWSQARLGPAAPLPVLPSAGAPSALGALPQLPAAPALAPLPQLSLQTPGLSAADEPGPLSPTSDPQDAVAPEKEAFQRGAAFSKAALEYLERSAVAKPYADLMKDDAVPVAVVEPDRRLERVQDGQAALFDIVFPRIYFNKRAVGEENARAAKDWAPTLLHELKHYQSRKALKDIPSQENELEAYHVQALFLLEQIDQDPGYLDKLPEALKGRAEALLEDWIRGPESLSMFVRMRYMKTPSVFDEPEGQAELLRAQLAQWRDRLENYAARRDELAAEARKAKDLEGRMAAERFGGGPGRSAALERAVRDYPFRETVEHVVLGLLDCLDYWQSPERQAASKAHYAQVHARVRGDWEAWKAAHPGFRLRPPSAFERLLARLRKK